MKKTFSIFTLLLVIMFAVSCSSNEEDKPRYNKKETRELIKTYDNNGGKLSHGQYSNLIKNTRLLFTELKETMKTLMMISEPLRFTQEYQKLKNDEDFYDKLIDREQAWRVLVLGQKDFSPENAEEFRDLPDENRRVDYYDECIRLRITQQDSIM